MAPFVYGTLADIRQVMVRAMKRLNFDSDHRTWLRPIHSLRDTFITRLAQQGIPLDRRMKLAGHRDPAMNLAYGEIEPDSHQRCHYANLRLSGGNLIDLDGLFLRSAGEPTDDPAYS